MSTTVDSRVVEMRFDNQHFEKNVSTTMSTLDKLKQKLNLTGASKSLEGISAAAKKVDLTPIGNSADKVALRFDAMYTVADQVLRNITDRAIEAGKRLVSSLSIDQITAGWSKYEQKTASIQTIMNATGKEIDDVNGYLDKLMWFSDETSYGFTDMTSALATMTASGGDIEKLIPMIMGVANATAYAGKGASEFSRIMQYAINQAYSLGYMQLMDWKSIQGAGVNSAQLMQTLIDAGVELGKISEGEVTTSNFTSTLADKWLDTEVMEKAFGVFAEMSEKAYEMVESGLVDSASKAYEILSEEYEGISITAAKAAQEAKSFTEAIEATKDAVSSGWMKSFEIVFGNYEKAKVTWTELANYLWDVFASGAETRNWALTGIFDFGTAWKGILENLGIKEVEDTSEATKKAAETVKYFQEVVDEVWYGTYQNKDTGRFNMLEKAGYDAELVQELVNLGYAHKLTIEEIEAAHNKLGRTFESTSQTAEEVDMSITSLTEAQLANSSLTEEQKELYRELEKQAKKAGVSVDTFVKAMSFEGDKNNHGTTGRALLIESIKNIGRALGDLVDIAKSAFGDIFDIPSVSTIIVKVYGMIVSLEKFTECLRLVKGESETLTETGEKFYRAFKGVFAIIKVITSIMGAGFKLALGVASKLLDKLGVGLLDVAASAGDIAVRFQEWYEETLGVTRVLEMFDPLIQSAAEFITEFVDACKNSKWLSTLGDIIKGMADGLAIFVGAVSVGVIQAFVGILDLLADVLSIVFENLTKLIESIKGSQTVNKFVGAAKKWPDIFNKISKALTDFAVAVVEWATSISELSLIKTVAGWVESAGETIADTFATITDHIANFGNSKVMKGINLVGDVMSGVAGAVTNSDVFQLLAASLVGAGGALKNAFTNLQLPKFDLDDANTLFKKLSNLKDQVDKDVGESGTVGIGDWLSAYFTRIKDTLAYNWETFCESMLEKFANFYLKYGDTIEAAFNQAKNVVIAIRDFVFAGQEVNLPAILDLAEKFLWILVLVRTLKLLKTIVSPLDNITSAIENLTSSIKWKAVSAAFLGMSVMLVALTACIIVIASMPDLNQAAKAAGLLVGVIVVLGIVIGAILWFLSKNKIGFDVTGATAALLMLVGSIFLMVYTIKEIDKMQLKDPGATFTNLFLMLTALVVGIKMVAKAGGSGFKAVAAILTMVTALKMLLEVLDAYAEYDWTGKQKALQRMTKMLFTLAGAMAVASMGVKSGASAKGLGFTVLAMVFSLKILLSVIKEIAETDTADLIKGGSVVTIMLGILSAMMIGIALANKDAKGIGKNQKAVNGFGGLVLALVGVIAAIWLLNLVVESIGVERTIACGLGVAAILGIFTWMLSTVGKSMKSVRTGSLIAMMIMMGILLAEIAFIITKLKDLPFEGTATAVGALSAVLLSMAYLMQSISGLKIGNKSGKKIRNIIGVFAGLVVLLGVIAVILGGMDALEVNGLNSINNAIALCGVLVVLAHLVPVILNTIKTIETAKITEARIAKFNSAMSMLLGMLAVTALVLTAMGGGSVQLGNGWVGGLVVNGATNAITNAIALSGMLVVLTSLVPLMLKSMEAIDSCKVTEARQKRFFSTMESLIEIMALMGAILTLMGGGSITTDDGTFKFNGATNAVANAIALSVMMGALTLIANATANFPDVDNGAIGKMYALLGVVLGLAVILGVLTYAIGATETDPNSMIPIASALGILLLALSAAFRILQSNVLTIVDSDTLITLGVLVAIVVALAVVLHAIKDVQPENAIGNAVALSILIGVLTLVASVLGLFGSGAGWMIAGAVAMGVLVGVMALAVRVLEMMKEMDPEKNLGHVKVLADLMLLLTVVAAAMAILGFLGENIVKGAVGMAALGLVMAELTWVLGLMQEMDATKNILNAMALSTLMYCLAEVAQKICIIGALLIPIGLGALAMTALALVMVELKWILGMMQNMDPTTNIANATALTILMYCLRDVAVALGELGVNVLAANVGVDGMIVLAGVMALIALILKMMEDMGLEKAEENAAVLTSVLDKFAEIIKVLAIYGPAAVLALAAAGVVLLVLGVLAAVFGAVAALASLIPEETREKILSGVQFVMDILSIVAGGLGDMISSFLEGIEPGLSGYGEDLAAFANAFADISPDVMQGVKALAEAVKILIEANVADAISNLILTKITGSDSGLAAFGTTMQTFASAIATAATSLKDLTQEDIEKFKLAAEAGLAMADLNDALPKSGGKWQEWTGSTATLDDWGETVKAFVGKLVEISAILTDADSNFNKQAILDAAEAGQAMAEVNDAIPEEDGVWQWWAGSKDISTWGEKLEAFAESLVAYSEKVNVAEFNKQAILDSAEAAEALATLNGNLPSQNGLYEAIMGEKNLGLFGSQIKLFADGLLNYANAASKLDETKIAAITNSGTAVDEMVKVAEKIPKTGGLDETVLGTTNIQSFGLGFAALANGIKNYVAAAAGLPDDASTKIGNTKGLVEKMAEIIKVIPNEEDAAAVTRLVTICQKMESANGVMLSLSAIEHDYSGLDSFKGAVTKIDTMASNLDSDGILAKVNQIYTVCNNIFNAAKLLNYMNDATYPGVGYFKTALTDLAEVDLQGVLDKFASETTLNSLATSVNTMMINATVAVELGAAAFTETFGAACEGMVDAGIASIGTVAQYMRFYSAGSYLVNGFVAGIDENDYKAAAAAAAMAKAAKRAAEKALAIKSPSRVFYGIGDYAGMGFVNALADYADSSYDTAFDMAESAKTGLGDAIARIRNMIDSGMDTQPTIKPIMDLSDIRSGVGTMSNLLDFSSSGNILASVGSINATMNRRNQNGGAEDVVSAIDKLRKDLANTSNTTYNLNGLSYSNDAELDAAFKTIVRAARMERRV